jgi:hypothetical protein
MLKINRFDKETKKIDIISFNSMINFFVRNGFNKRNIKKLFFEKRCLYSDAFKFYV